MEVCICRYDEVVSSCIDGPWGDFLLVYVSIVIIYIGIKSLCIYLSSISSESPLCDESRIIILKGTSREWNMFADDMLLLWYVSIDVFPYYCEYQLVLEYHTLDRVGK